LPRLPRALNTRTWVGRRTRNWTKPPVSAAHICTTPKPTQRESPECSASKERSKPPHRTAPSGSPVATEEELRARIFVPGTHRLRPRLHSRMFCLFAPTSKTTKTNNNMPIYEYTCQSCETIFERLLRISQMKEPLAEPCPECNSNGAIFQNAHSSVWEIPSSLVTNGLTQVSTKFSTRSRPLIRSTRWATRSFQEPARCKEPSRAFSFFTFNRGDLMSKRKPQQQSLRNNGNQEQSLRLAKFQPLTDAQKDVWDAWKEGFNLLLSGCAGTGRLSSRSIWP
jgi:putative FmdB family regulatory protein